MAGVKVGPNTNIPISNGKTAPAASGPSPSGQKKIFQGFGPGADFVPAKSNGKQLPNQGLAAPGVALFDGSEKPSPENAADHGQPTTTLDSGDYNPSTMRQP